ncbi:hypothetical protein DRH29_02175 [candidate division Kazan bacterium]|uniref:DUF5671 domain-containing protein n=1 Tax=candidate division Kazan bacterium TaxID=2202143 RepID=A0A420ZD61_UNCK3|nr:MAG: hypothetical protein DRH29_02175 [candidate division Kazan bacterium]
MNESRYNLARDGFVYLLSYATLVISSVGFNFLAKALVNRFLPDAVDFGNFLNDSAIIGFLAAVIIAFPIFLYINWLANRMLGSGKMRHNTGVRHWLIYITLVVVILIIIWQLIALFISFLGGTLVSRFLIHTAITLSIAAAILGYQWWHLKFFDGNQRRLGSGFKIFEWVVVILVTATVVGTFFIIDSPAVRRVKRLDATRVERLSSLQENIQSFYGWGKDVGHGRLPKTLDELIQDPRVYIAEDGMVDPVTKERFKYRVLTGTTYELCATFDTEFTAEDKDDSRLASPEPSSRFQRFYHGIGLTCFDLSVE